jgi:hypothetical protein
MRNKKVDADIWKLRELSRRYEDAKPVMVFFFRSAPREGMPEHWMRWCAELANEVASESAVSLFYGPRNKSHLKQRTSN